MTLKVLSWNIWCDCDFSRVAGFLSACDADIIGLQEIVPGDKERDIVGFLSRLGYEYAVAPKGMTFSDGRMITSGVFSRYSIRTSTMLTLSEVSSRQAVKAEIDILGKIFTIYSFHLKHTHQKEDPVQNGMADVLIVSLPKERVILMGDFNATPDMTPIKRMREALVDTSPDAPPTLDAALFDCPDCDHTRISQTCLDYIFVSKDLKTHSPKVEGGKGSDHFPVSVALEF